MVSVVMAVRDGAASVEAAVTSILGQHGVDLELLIHDDGSTDATASVLATLAAGDARVHVSGGPNRGPAAARNELLERARGEYVAFMDHDDLWPSGRLARQLALMEDAPGVLGETMVFERLGADGHPARTPRSRRVLAGLLQAGTFRRAAVERTGGFSPTFTVADDFDFLLRMIETCGPLRIEPDVAAWYRVHDGQWTGDLEVTGQATARALAGSLRRRREGGRSADLAWRASS